MGGWWALVLGCGPSPAECRDRAAALLGEDRAHPEANRALACACDGGVAEACTALAVRLRDGIGGPEDPAGAIARHRRACDLGDGAGCNGLGGALVSGRGTAPDPEAAHAAFVRGCEAARPSARACSNAGNDLFTGRTGEQDFAAAAAWFDRGCRLGDAASCEQAKAARDPAGAARRFRTGCALGDPRACLNFAVVLPPGDPERNRLLELACAAELDEACSLRR